MKPANIYRANIFILGKLSQDQLDSFKEDLLEHVIQGVFKVKNLNLTKDEITLIANNAIDHVFLRYDPKSGEVLGDMVKNQVYADLRAEFEKLYPSKVNRVKWPDLIQKKAAKHLLGLIRKLQSAPKSQADKILAKANEELKGRQQQILSTMMSLETTIGYTELMEKFDIALGTVAKDVKIIYKTLIDAIDLLDIQL